VASSEGAAERSKLTRLGAVIRIAEIVGIEFSKKSVGTEQIGPDACETREAGANITQRACLKETTPSLRRVYAHICNRLGNRTDTFSAPRFQAGPLGDVTSARPLWFPRKPRGCPQTSVSGP
jgi:hypothetical protein